MEPLGELEEGDAALDHDGAALEVEVVDARDLLGADDDGVLVAALRVVPHVALAGRAHTLAGRDGLLDQSRHVLDAGGVMHLGDVVARGVAGAVERVPLEGRGGAAKGEGPGEDGGE